jgi:hypothetical protein
MRSRLTVGIILSVAFFFIVSTIVGLIWALLAQVALLTAWAFVTWIVMFDKDEDERYPPND